MEFVVLTGDVVVQYINVSYINAWLKIYKYFYRCYLTSVLEFDFILYYHELLL